MGDDRAPINHVGGPVQTLRPARDEARVGVLLALQRLVGNHAVAAVIQRRPPDSPPPAGPAAPPRVTVAARYDSPLEAADAMITAARARRGASLEYSAEGYRLGWNSAGGTGEPPAAYEDSAGFVRGFDPVLRPVPDFENLFGQAFQANVLAAGAERETARQAAQQAERTPARSGPVRDLSRDEAAAALDGEGNARLIRDLDTYRSEYEGQEPNLGAPAYGFRGSDGTEVVYDPPGGVLPRDAPRFPRLPGGRAAPLPPPDPNSLSYPRPRAVGSGGEIDQAAGAGAVEGGIGRMSTIPAPPPAPGPGGTPAPGAAPAVATSQPTSPVGASPANTGSPSELLPGDYGGGRPAINPPEPGSPPGRLGPGVTSGGLGVSPVLETAIEWGGPITAILGAVLMGLNAATSHPDPWGHNLRLPDGHVVPLESLPAGTRVFGIEEGPGIVRIRDGIREIQWDDPRRAPLSNGDFD